MGNDFSEQTLTPAEQAVVDQCYRAKAAARRLAYLSTQVKNAALEAMAQALVAQQARILQANAQDIQAAQARGMAEAMQDRLLLTASRIVAMADGLREVAALPDPIGEVIDGWRRPNGLEIRRVRVPLGVIGIIFESRPNVTVDAAALCLKSGNAVVLRGGSEAIHSNIALAQVIAEAAYAAGIPEGAIEFVASTDRAAAQQLMRMNGVVDVLIPRGGAGLIQTVVRTATVPTIETGVGNCHVYVDASADLDMAEELVVNSKCHRPSVCNAAETLLVHRAVAEVFLPRVGQALQARGVELRGDEATRALVPNVTPATDEDYAVEFLALIMAVRVVDSIDDAMDHIDRFGSKHTELIVTRDFHAATRFQHEVDASTINVNASTRFTDGGQFGLGAEIGISTQKLHARGPMGLRELTSTKFLVVGDGQVRE
ncbi:MAG TPA: glutamate-5-semialdehyde dehydrogenase [Armatimonadota bacterium]|jgi:glutamate-5-semialdehyde dehydrogenase